jgi:hypothetical protein
VKPRVESNDHDTAAARWNERVGINSVTTSLVAPDEVIDSGPESTHDTKLGDTVGSPTEPHQGSTAND